MIAVDTSALMAILQEEPLADACDRILVGAGSLCISAGTVAEAMIVAVGRGRGPRMAQLLGSLSLEVIPVTAETARRIGGIYARFGKGMHPAGLNFGDCFAYDVARQLGCPLLFVGEDFARTDVRSAISEAAGGI